MRTSGLASVFFKRFAEWFCPPYVRGVHPRRPHVLALHGLTRLRTPGIQPGPDRLSSARPPPIMLAPLHGSFVGFLPPNVPSFGRWLLYSGLSRPVGVLARQQLPWTMP